jgi:hypothetical protein
MGILDDAIKEHLELKRKHGVPEDELQRQEEEALGPARRDVAQQHEEAEPAAGRTATAEADGPEATVEADEPAEPAESDEPSASEETALFDMEAAAGEPAASKPIEIEEPDAVPEAEPASRDAPGDTEPHGFEAVEDEELEDQGELADGAREEPEPDDEELLSAEEETAAEDGDPDVLEDTPDFLQETPEHDRLWFEQKPPRDFDFD